MSNSLELFSKIRVFIFDVDGVLTNGQLLVQPDGTLLRSMNIKDGYALQLAIRSGYHVWVISGAANTGVKERLVKLGVTETFFGVPDKVAVLQALVEKYQIPKEQLLYMGDDMPDKETMALCGLATAPNDACSDILQIVDYISPYNGGCGCVRDVIEKVLKIQEQWQ